MRTQTYVSILLSVSVAGALGLAGFIGLTLWRIERAAETSGHASKDYQLVEAFVSNTDEMLAVMDIMTVESSGVMVILERLIERGRQNLTELDQAEMFAGSRIVPEIAALFEHIVTQAAHVAIGGLDGAARDAAHEQYDDMALGYIAQIESMSEVAALFAENEELMLASKRARGLWSIGALSAAYLVLILFVRRWTTRRLVQPVQSLADAADRAMIEDAPFSLDEDGPREVRLLTRVLHNYIGGLEETVHARTAELKTVKEILPLCSHCKNVRDDEGYWHRVDMYMAENNNVEISHGICPDCLLEHYPEFSESEL